MRTVVEHDVATRHVNVWVFTTADGDYVLRMPMAPLAVPTWDQVEFGERPAPTLRLDESVFAAIVQEGMQVVPASSVMERAWKDAIGVRDRLLSIIEKGSQ